IFGYLVKRNGLGRFAHQRELPAPDSHAVRPNRDTLLSMAVFDLDAGPVTITLPDPGPRFMSMYVVDEDHYAPVVHYGAGGHTLAREQIGTRYVYVGLRFLVAADDARDVTVVHALQDATEIEQKGGPGTFQVPNFDTVSWMRVRDALFALGNTLT